MLLEMNSIVKYAADRCLFQVDRLAISPGEKIGLVGRNGAGKSTLLDIMAGRALPDGGQIKRHCTPSYIAQLERRSVPSQPDAAWAQRFAVNDQFEDFFSGGEQTRYQLAAAFSENNDLLLADEPTANLDLQAIVLLQEKLSDYRGAFVIVSHDHQLLDNTCHVIWELADGGIRVYPGNYSSYIIQKENEYKHKTRVYEAYQRKKHQLETGINDRKNRSRATRKAPVRMGNSEARLHKMGDQKAKASLDRAVAAMKSRLAKLEVKEKPQVKPTAVFEFGNDCRLISKVVIRGEQLSCCFSGRYLFHNVDFQVGNGQKIALVGPNGCGKTTLLKMMMTGYAGIAVAPGVRLGYYAQGMETLDLKQSVLVNVLAGSQRTESAVRDLLAQLLFRREDVFKRAGVLSGGEQARVSLAKLIASNANVLLLDEPANYLDMPSLIALQEVLAAYKGTVLFACHDRQLIDCVATQLLLFNQGEICSFVGTYSQYLLMCQEKQRCQDDVDSLVLQHRLTELISRLSTTTDKHELARLDKEYQRLLVRQGRLKV